jgi:predicted aminopeptidase
VIRNPAAKDGHWKVNGKRQVIYAKAKLSVRDRFIAAYERAAEFVMRTPGPNQASFAQWRLAYRLRERRWAGRRNQTKEV